jgi:hypothetical protein
MPSGNKFDIFAQDMALKQHNLGADNLMVMLTNTAPSASNTIKSNISEIGAGGGYTTNGNAPGITSCTQSGGLLKLIMPDTTFTGSGAGMASFRYVVFFNHTNDKLIGWWDDGTVRTLANTEQYIVDFDQVNGVLAFQ